MVSAVRTVEAFDTKDEATEALFAYARRLVDTLRFGLFVEYLPGAGWAVQLIDRQCAPTRAAAKRKGNR